MSRATCWCGCPDRPVRAPVRIVVNDVRARALREDLQAELLALRLSGQISEADFGRLTAIVSEA